MMNKNSKIYIAGHTGMVGSAIVRRLQREGFQRLILKTRKEVNLLEQKAVRSFFEKERPEYVIVAAARVGSLKVNMTYPADFIYENIQIQNNVIWNAHEYNIKKLMFLGSSCIYPHECPQPMKEEYFMTGRLEPTNEGYALAKIAGMKLCEYIYGQFGQFFISCMPANIYGVGDHFDFESAHVIPALLKRMHEAKVHHLPHVVVWGSGMNRREFLYVDDLADAVVWLMNHYEKKEFLNIGTGKDIPIQELAEEIKKIVGYEGVLVFDTSKPDGISKRLLDVGNVHNLGWHHTIDLHEGLVKTYQWYLNHA